MVFSLRFVLWGKLTKFNNILMFKGKIPLVHHSVELTKLNFGWRMNQRQKKESSLNVYRFKYMQSASF